jgi:tetraacyldisaccharide 4'-kinase
LLIRPADYRTLVSGRRRGAGAALARAALRAAEIPYTLVVDWRNRRYDRGVATPTRAAAQVISVGNLTLGGTGKTPLVAWLADWFQQQGLRVAIVSRGYRAAAGRPNDEALELAQLLPDVPHLQNPDRIAAARAAIARWACQLIVADDAFQHRRLARDLDIVLLDALEPFGYGHVFPRGLLRERPSGLARAAVVVLSRADLVSAPRRAEIRDRVARLAPAALWVEVAQRPRRLLAADSRQQDWQSLAGTSVAAFCGLGNPAGFRGTLQACGCDLAAWREFPDHHDYGPEDLEALAKWVRQAGSIAAVLCTHKDLVKINRTELGGRPLWALAIGLEVLRGEPALLDRLGRLRDAAAGCEA